MEEVEVRVHRVRRRRSDPFPKPPRPTNVRNWMIYAALAGITSALMFEGFLNHKPQHASLPVLSEATGVRSVITTRQDSLQIVVSWDLTLSTPEGQPDSIRVRVVAPSLADSFITTQAATVFADTAFLPAPAPGQTLAGSSCVAAQHSSLPPTESCTPWQYVRPPATAQAGAGIPQHIVIHPSGLQVDPDVNGRCAKWQQSHSGESVWITVNSIAIAECTGANGRPTVAQFCAFIVLPDGRRIKAATSERNSYCEELFVEWSRERYS
jgi:hypothetical protein